MSTTALVPVTEAPRQIQALAAALTDVGCCEPSIAGVRSFAALGTEFTWEIEIVHELIAKDGDGQPYRHGRRTLCRISSFDG